MQLCLLRDSFPGNEDKMEELEKISVDSPDAVGAKATMILIKDTLADLNLTRAFDKIKVFVDPVEPVFIFTGLLRLSAPAIKLKDFAEVGMGALGKDEVKIELKKETYTVKLLDKLWARYGKERLDQPDKKVIVIKTKKAAEEVDVLQDTIIDEPRQEIIDRLVDAIALRIIPEGFRVRNHELTESHVLFVASEDTLKPEWIEKGKKILSSLRREEDNA